jgi:predicted DNA-binding antitoxin AbrB/MazE fold protein
MMSLELEVTYEDGVLKPERPLPLNNGQRVKITVHSSAKRARTAYGLMGWTGDPQIVEQVALDPDLGIHEAP